MANYLEEFAAEYLEFTGYAVRRNIQINRPGGGFNEIDILGMRIDNPSDAIWIECTSAAVDPASIATREKKKFSDCSGYVNNTLACNPKKVIVWWGRKTKLLPLPPGIEEWTVKSLYSKAVYAIRKHLKPTQSVPETFPILRTIWLAQFLHKSRRTKLARKIRNLQRGRRRA